MKYAISCLQYLSTVHELNEKFMNLYFHELWHFTFTNCSWIVHDHFTVDIASVDKISCLMSVLTTLLQAAIQNQHSKRILTWTPPPHTHTRRVQAHTYIHTRTHTSTGCTLDQLIRLQDGYRFVLVYLLNLVDCSTNSQNSLYTYTSEECMIDSHPYAIKDDFYA